MPSKSPAQAHLMAGIAHGWKPTGGMVGGHAAPPVDVAKEFNAADTGGAMLAAPKAPHLAVQMAQAQALRGGHVGHPFGKRGKKATP